MTSYVSSSVHLEYLNWVRWAHPGVTLPQASLWAVAPGTATWATPATLQRGACCMRQRVPLSCRFGHAVFLLPFMPAYHGCSAEASRGNFFSACMLGRQVEELIFAQLHQNQSMHAVQDVAHCSRRAVRASCSGTQYYSNMCSHARSAAGMNECACMHATVRAERCVVRWWRRGAQGVFGACIEKHVYKPLGF